MSLIIIIAMKYIPDTKIQQKEIIMNNNYKILTEERTQIDSIISDAETLNRAYENGNIIVSSNYYRYIVLLVIVIILIILFLNFSFTSKQSGGSNMLNKINIYNAFSYFFILIVVINLIYYGYNS
jgi:hydroxymethylglutaryl-CoA reductase